MTKKEFLDLIIAAFEKNIVKNHFYFEKYCYNNHECDRCLTSFMKEVEKLGLSFGTNHHAHGIGNNNEQDIFLKETDDEGFIIEKKIASFRYTYGIYGGCSVYLSDYGTGKQVRSLNYAR